MKALKTAGCILAATFAISSCSNEVSGPEENEGNALAINAIHPSQTSRVTDAGFENGDRIGVFVVESSASLQPGGNMVNNGSFTYDGTNWNPGRTYYWNNGKYNVYAYYPYADKVDDTEDYSFAVQTDQSTAAGYSKSDFLWASATDQTASAAAVPLKFSHSLSCVVVKVEKADGYKGELPADMDVFIHGTYTTASIDLSNGGATADSRTSLQSIKAKKVDATTFSAIAVPQRVDSRRPLVEVTAGKVSYILEGTISLKPGYKHTITVKLSQSPKDVEIEIGGGIGNWN